MLSFLHKRNSIEIPPEAQQRLQCARIAVLGCDVHGIVPAGGLGIHVSPMHQQVRDTFRVARRPAPLMTPQNSLWHRVTLPAAHRVRRTDICRSVWTSRFNCPPIIYDTCDQLI